MALPYIRSLIDKAHEKGMPVIYTTGVRRGDNWDSGCWSWKNNRGTEDASNRRDVQSRRQRDRRRDRARPARTS